MAIVERHVSAPPPAVWAVLADGWTFSNWVVGASHIRAVDADWPAVGSVLHHSQGTWPLTLDDEATVEVCEADRRLVLVARGRPLGEARVDISLEAAGSGTRVVLAEAPISGPGKWLHNPAAEALLARRNTETLSRLAAIAERRTIPRA